MRAADTVHPAPVRPERCYQLSDDIARMRRLIFQFEAAACTPPVSTITINTLQLRWAKGILGALIAERAALGGPMPQDVLDSWTTWENHSWTPPANTPFDVFLGVFAAPPASYKLVNGTLLQETFATPAPPGLPPLGPIYLVLAGAKFAIPTTAELTALGLQSAPIHNAAVITDATAHVTASAIGLLPNIPAEGTLIRERGTTQFYLIQDGAKRLIVNPSGYLSRPTWTVRPSSLRLWEVSPRFPTLL